MQWVGYIGIVSLVLGVLYLIVPGFIKKLDDWGRHILISVDHTLKYKTWVGLFFVIAGIALIYVGFAVK